MPDFKRRALVAAALLAGLAGAPASAQQQPAAFPARTITLYSAFSVGSGPDVVLRIVAQGLSRIWSQSVVVENRPGGGGFVALEAVRRLPADGHALIQLDSEHLAALPHLYKARNFKTLEHFDPVAPLFHTPFMVAVRADSPWKSMADLVAAARAKPDAVTYGSWFVGSPGHLGGEWLDSLAGTKMVHVPYREVSQLYTSVANGDVDWSFASIPSSQGVYQSGKIRYLAVAAPARIAQLPDVPTVAEAGGPAELDVNSFVSLLAPRGVPEEIRARIHADVLKVLADPEVRARFATFAFEPLGWSVAEIASRADAKSQQYAALIERANISLD